jgi:hypothetical protein
MSCSVFERCPINDTIHALFAVAESDIAHICRGSSSTCKMHQQAGAAYKGTTNRQTQQAAIQHAPGLPVVPVAIISVINCFLADYASQSDKRYAYANQY